MNDLNRSEFGPFDVSEVGQLKPYIDFGAIRVSPSREFKLRAELDEKSKKVIAITILLPESTLQLQAFAAPKSRGIWSEALEPIQKSVANQGGSAEVRQGLLGDEIRAQVTVENDGKKTLRSSVFFGVDGPRWMLRGVIYGKAATEPEQYQRLIEIFRSCVVDRGNTPLPPNELLPLRLPQNQGEQSE